MTVQSTSVLFGICAPALASPHVHFILHIEDFTLHTVKSWLSWD